MSWVTYEQDLADRLFLVLEREDEEWAIRIDSIVCLFIWLRWVIQ